MATDTPAITSIPATAALLTEPWRLTDLAIVAGTEHRPIAARGPAYAMLLERPETKQFGNE